MDDSREPSNSAPGKYRWEDGDALGDSAGPTGVFGTAPASSAESHSHPLTQVVLQERAEVPEEPRGSAPQAATRAGRDGLQEPIVHKVVVGGGSRSSSADLLELLRTSSPAAGSVPQSSVTQPFPAGPVGASTAATPPLGSSPREPGEGFTQLLRALSTKAPPAVDRQEVEERSSSTYDSDLSRTPATSKAQSSADLSQQPDKGAQLGQPISSAPPSRQESGFTSLLQGFSGGAVRCAERPDNFKPLDQAPEPNSATDRFAARSVPPAPGVSGQAAPGIFTQLFSTLTPPAAGPNAQEPAKTSPSLFSAPTKYQEPPRRPSSEGSSFTQLISTLGRSPSEASPYNQGRDSSVEDLSRLSSPVRDERPVPSQSEPKMPDWTAGVSRPPRAGAPSESGNLTRLLRTLSEPAKGSEIPTASPIAAESPAPSSSARSLFTQTYKKLDGASEPVAPTAPAQYSPADYSSSGTLSATRPFSTQPSSGSFADFGKSAAAVPNLPSGPSEVTRIIDASKLREMQRGGVSAPPPAAALPQGLPMQFAAPVLPPMPNLQWSPQVPPTPATGQPMQFGGGMQMPQYTPPAPTPQMPASAATPAGGKMQQYLPLLLIIIIFLLVVILVTVVFLLKD